MLGHKVRGFKPLPGICLEDLVPADNFYRQVERSIDLSFVRELAAEFYSNIGCTSIDPVVFFKLQLIAFFEGIRSERGRSPRGDCQSQPGPSLVPRL